MRSSPSAEERFWAVIAHLSAVAFGMGILLPILGWSTHKEKSKYASFQSLQALGYQSLGYTIWILGALVIIIIQSLKTLSRLTAAAEAGADFSQLTVLAMSGHFVILMVLIGLYVILPLVGAVACAMGREFRYPILGGRLAWYVQYNPDVDNKIIEDHEDRFVVAMGHFAVIVVLWGMLSPFVTWVLQGKRSLFLRIQSMQTLVYQICVTLLFFIGGLIYLLGFAIFLGTVGLNSNTSFNGTGLIGLGMFGISMLCVVGILLVIPLLHILGQWAGYRVLKGEDYRYPIVGRIVERRIRQRTEHG